MKRFFFLGIGGIGMSALARYYRTRGCEVYGYDRVRSALCQQLEAEGCKIMYDDNPDNPDIPAIPDIPACPANPANPDQLEIIYTPAIPKENRLRMFFEEHNLPMKKRAQVLGDITRESRGLCVAGTHGKTTTSTMIAHIIRQSSVDCSAFLGGISNNYDNNLILADNDSDLVVIEADEFDRSFHQLSPYMAVVTATDADHLDIYGTHEAYLEAFAHFVSLIREDGVLIVRDGVTLDRRVKPGVRVYSYGIDNTSATSALKGQNTLAQGNALGASATQNTPCRGITLPNFYATNIHCGNGELTFDFVSPNGRIENIKLGVPVMVNVENAVAAMAIAQLNGVSDEELKRGIETFAGVKRRFETKCKRADFVHIDDYAHHPDELRRSIESVRMLYADRRMVTVFQPHLFTRTRDFYREFASALSLCDKVVLLDIYPAREEPIPGITSQIILDEVTSREKCLCRKEDLSGVLKAMDAEVVLTVGAGDIGEIKLDL